MTDKLVKLLLAEDNCGKEAFSEPEDTQNQLGQHEKIATLGQLSLGFVRQIAKPLNVITMGMEFLGNVLPQIDEKLKEPVRRINQAVNKANNLVDDFLQFSRTSEFELESVDICQLLDETIDLFGHRALANSIEIHRNWCEESIEVKANKNILQQVFINFFTNAFDAMPKGGDIRINVYNKKLEDVGYRIGYRETDYFKTGDMATVVEFEDTGQGIPKDVLPMIFQPYFSTKETEKRAGLGLSMAHLIIERHQGTIDVESAAKKGTRFTINLHPAGNEIR